MNLPRFGVEKPVSVNLMLVAILVVGAFAAVTLRRQFFPDLDPESASLSLPYPGASPDEVEEGLAQRVEDVLANLDVVNEMRTVIVEGGGTITVTFREGLKNFDDAVDEVERAVEALRDLPEDSERIQVMEGEFRLPVIMVQLHGEADEEVLKQSIRRVRDDLKSLPGMGAVHIDGPRDYEVRVDVRPETLIEHGLSLPEVSQAISAWMAEVPGGTVRGRGGNVDVRTLGVPERAAAIRRIVVRASTDGQVLHVGDIATVRETFADQQVMLRYDGRPSVFLTVYKIGRQDIVEMAEMVRAYVDGRTGRAFEPRPMERLLPSRRAQAWSLGEASEHPIPPGCDLAITTDLARFVEGRLDLLRRNAIYGAVLVFLTLMLTLNMRLAFWAGVGLVTAMAGALAMMLMLDITLNFLTMFGLIVVLGLLVDDAIVVSENIQARYDRGEEPMTAAVRGATEVMWPVVATILTSIVAFMPLMFIKGQAGDMMGALPMVVSCALAMSLLESLFILPSHLGHSLKRRARHARRGLSLLVERWERARDRFLHQRLIPAYAALLGLLLRWRYVTMSASLGVLIVSIGFVAGGRIGYRFFPASDAETILLNVRMPVGTPIEETDAVVRVLEDTADREPEVTSVSSIIGYQTDVDSDSGVSLATHVAQLFIELTPAEMRTRDAATIAADYRTAVVDRVPGIERLSFTLLGGEDGGAAITVRITGRDPRRMEALASIVRADLDAIVGVHDIADDNDVGQRELRIELKPDAAALGFTVADVARQVRGALYGVEAHRFSYQAEVIDVRVRLDGTARHDLSAIERMWVVAPGGASVPLAEIAELSDGAGSTTIRRIDRRRAVTVTAATAPGLSPEQVVAELNRSAVPRWTQAFPDLAVSFRGRQQEQAEAFGSMPWGFLAACIMIYVILAWLFSSYVMPIAVMAGIPFALIGVVWGHWLTGYELTFLSLIGFVALSGIVVNDSLILVRFFLDRREAGTGLVEALKDAGRQRLRPILLTTITTVLGLTPLMLEESFQAKFLIPMAISISFGLMSATVLILLLLPCLIVISDDCRAVAHFLWHGRLRLPESASAS